MPQETVRATGEAATGQATARGVHGVRAARGFQRATGYVGDTRGWHFVPCRRTARAASGSVRPHAYPAAPIGEVLRNRRASAEAASAVQEAWQNQSDFQSSWLPCDRLAKAPSTGSVTVRCSNFYPQIQSQP